MPIYTSEVNKAGDAVIHNSGTGSTINGNFDFKNSAGNAADGSIGMVARSNAAFVLGTTGENVPTGTNAYAISLNNGYLVLNNENTIAQNKIVTITFWACAPGTGYNAGVGFSANAEDESGDGMDLKVQQHSSLAGSYSAINVHWQKSTTTLDPEAFSNLAGANGTIDHSEFSLYSGGGSGSAPSNNKVLHAYKISFKLENTRYVRILGGSGSNTADDIFLYDLKVEIEDSDDETGLASRENLTFQIDKDSTHIPSTSKISFTAGSAGTEVANIDESGNLQIDGGLTAAGTVVNATAVTHTQAASHSATRGFISKYSNTEYTSIASGVARLRFANDTQISAPVVQFARGRGTFDGSLNATTVTNNLDWLGQIDWYGVDGGPGWGLAAQIVGVQDGTSATGGDSTDVPGMLKFKTSPDGTSVPVERLTIRQNGKIEIHDGNIEFGKDQNVEISTENSYHDAAGKSLTISAGSTTGLGNDDVAGGSITFKAGQGKGSGAGGDIVFQTANAGLSGNSINSLATALTISDDLSSTFGGVINVNNDITIKRTANDANSANLLFVKDKGAAGADGDDIGTIKFTADNAAQEQTDFAKILAEVREADDTDEAGKLTFWAAATDGSTSALVEGMEIRGSTATAGKVDIDLGAHATSLVTLAGDLKVSGGDIKTDGTLTLKADSNADGDEFIYFKHNADDTLGYFRGLDGLFYVPGTIQTGTGFTGDVTGNADSSTNATNVAITNNNSDSSTRYIALVGATSGNTGVLTAGTKFSCQPSTGTLNVDKLNAGSGVVIAGTFHGQRWESPYWWTGWETNVSAGSVFRTTICTTQLAALQGAEGSTDGDTDATSPGIFGWGEVSPSSVGTTEVVASNKGTGENSSDLWTQQTSSHRHEMWAMSSYPVYKKLVVEKIEITNMSRFQPMVYSSSHAKLCIATSATGSGWAEAGTATDEEVDISADIVAIDAWLATIDIGENFRTATKFGVPGEPMYIDVVDFELAADKKVHLFLYWKHNGVGASGNTQAGTSGTGTYRAYREWGNTDIGSDDINIQYGSNQDGDGFLLRFRLIGYYSQ